MANSLGGGFLAVYAKESLPQLIAQSPLFATFTTDFSGEAADQGTSLVTRIPTTTYTANDTEANGYAALAASASAVTVTLKQRDITHAFSEVEWRNADALIKTYAPAMVSALVNYISNDVLSVVTLANYATTLSSSAAGFSGSAVTKLSQLMSTANVPATDRGLIILPTLNETLVNTVNQAYFINPNANTKVYADMSINTYTNIPTTNGLVGLAAHKSAIAVVGRIPAAGPQVEQTIVTDEKSGFSVAFRSWHSADDGKWKLAATSVYGYAKGNGSALVRVVS
jgi:hypothetical protein